MSRRYYKRRNYHNDLIVPILVLANIFFYICNYKKEVSRTNIFLFMAIFSIIVTLLVECVRYLCLTIKEKERYKKYCVSGIREIDYMDGISFEHVCAAHLNKLGYNVKETSATNDKGADLIAKKGKDIIAVQCKRYKAKVPNSCVQEVVASMNVYGANKCMVITNSYFTSNCQQLAEANNCILWDRDTIIENFRLH